IRQALQCAKSGYNRHLRRQRARSLPRPFLLKPRATPTSTQKSGGTAMSGAAIGFAFGAGLLASVNPCGFVMLPALVSYYLGAEDQSFAQLPLAARVGRPIFLAFVVARGVLLVFGLVGALAMTCGRALLIIVPYAALLIGLALVLLGLWLLAGRELHIRLPQQTERLARDNPFALLVFGIS